MSAIIFHTMGGVDDVHAALIAQGITDSRQMPIAILETDWTNEHRGEAPREFFQISLSNTIIPTQENVVVIACGSKALKYYQLAKILPKNIGIEKTRGQFIPLANFGGSNGWLTASYDPNKSFPDFVAGFKADAMVAQRVAQTGKLKPTLPAQAEAVRAAGPFN